LYHNHEISFLKNGLQRVGDTTGHIVAVGVLKIDLYVGAGVTHALQLELGGMGAGR
jgi:hypothetical protein